MIIKDFINIYLKKILNINVTMNYMKVHLLLIKQKQEH